MEKAHKKLNVWQETINLVKMIYLETQNLPKEELYGLTSQMRRAAVSTISSADIKTVAANLFGLNISGTRVGFPVESELKYARIACSSGYSVYVISQIKDIRFTFGPLSRALVRKYLPEDSQ